MTKVITLKNPFYNGFEDKDDPVALEYFENLKEVFNAFEAGTLYVRFIDGDRNGSIARLKPDPNIRYSVPDIVNDGVIGRWARFRIKNESRFGILTWDKRKNRVKQYFPSPRDDFEYLIDYDGPTIWEKFDAKAAKEKILENPEQKDIDGVELSVGDKVMFVNLRYGQGASLDRGTIKEFKVSVDSKSYGISTVIENEEGVLSTIKYPSTMVYRI